MDAKDLQIPRYCYSLEVFDNLEQRTVINEGFNCQTPDVLIWHLERMIEKLKKDVPPTPR